MNSQHYHRLKHTPAYARRASRRVYPLTHQRSVGLADMASTARGSRAWPRGGFLQRSGRFPA